MSRLLQVFRNDRTATPSAVSFVPVAGNLVCGRCNRYAGLGRRGQTRPFCAPTIVGRPDRFIPSDKFPAGQPYNPHNHRPRGGSVQRGLSAAVPPRSHQPSPLRRINAVR